MTQQRFDLTVHVGFFLVLIACAWRFLAWSGLVAAAVPTLVVAAVLVVCYLAGALMPAAGRWLWLLVTVAVWAALTLMAASFTWCAVPLFFLALRILPGKAAIPVIVGMTAIAAIQGEVHAREAWDPSPIIAPVAIAVLATLFYQQLQRESARRQALIDDLVRTRDALAVSERAAGVLEERVRLSREIHDTLAQGLSSMHLLLNAADQEWAKSPDVARRHVRQAASAAQENLAEARQFVRDLAPPALQNGGLAEALQRLCESTTTSSGLAVEFRVEGEPLLVSLDAEIALLRVAQGALANVVQHAGARTVVVTLSYLVDAVTLDVCDDGVGFTPEEPSPHPDRGFGLLAIQQRITAMGGSVSIESTPGDGTVLAVSVPVAAPVVVG